MMHAKGNGMAKEEKLFLQAERAQEKGDFRESFKCLSVAAELGHPMSQVNLGNFYATGTGVQKNLSKAAFWYTKAYENGYSDGALNLAIDRRNAGRVRSAVIWFKKAIAMKNGDAYIALAKIYRTREGGGKTAIALLKRAQMLRRDQISDEARKEAVHLLKDLSA